MATLQLTHKLDHLLCFHRGTLRDLIGDMHASLKDGAQCVEGVGLVLDGVGAHAELAPGELGGAMSIAIRVAAKQLPVDRWTRLFDFSEHHGNLEHIFIDVHGSGGASWQTYTGPHWGPHPRSNDFKLQVGEWTTFVGIVQGDTMKFYRNGKILSQVQSPARAPPSMVRQAHLVGWSAWRDGQVAHFDGTVASMAIWSRALSDEEVEMVSACDMADMVELRVFTLNAVLSKSGAMTCCCINSAGEEAAALEVDPGKSLAWLHASIANLLGCSELSLRLVTPNGELIGESFDDWDATILSDVLGGSAPVAVALAPGVVPGKGAAPGKGAVPVVVPGKGAAGKGAAPVGPVVVPGKGAAPVGLQKGKQAWNPPQQKGGQALNQQQQQQQQPQQTWQQQQQQKGKSQQPQKVWQQQPIKVQVPPTQGTAGTASDRSRTPAPRNGGAPQVVPPKKGKAVLPRPWEEHFSEEFNLPYYWNSETGDAIWEKKPGWP